MRRSLSLFTVILTAITALFISMAPNASAYCTGHVNCVSGWHGVTRYDSSSGKNFNTNIAVDWYADNHRRVFASGSTCYPTSPYLCEGHDSLRIYYRSHGASSWALRVTWQPGPAYGTYTWADLTSSNPTLPHDWLVKGCSFGTCLDSPIITN
jgi:hypothetical protein